MAAPPKVEGGGTYPVRAFANVIFLRSGTICTLQIPFNGICLLAVNQLFKNG